MKTVLLCIGFALAFHFAGAQWVQKQFVIGTYADPRLSIDNNAAKDSASYALARNAYFNFLSGPQYHNGARDFSLMDRTLKLAGKFNMQLLVIDSRLKISDPSFDEATAKMIIDHFDSLNSPAFAGYYFGGEFPQKSAEAVKKWTSFFKRSDPGRLAYSYLLPQYAFPSKPGYENYVSSFLGGNLGVTSNDVVAYDYYPFSKNGTLLNSYFYNLDLLRRRAGNKPFWVYVLSTATPNYTDPTEYQLCFSAFCPIAYGAKGIIYFTYESIPDHLNLKFGDAIIDKAGKPTSKYYTVKKINEYITKVLGPMVMKSNYVGSYHATPNFKNEVVAASRVAGTASMIRQIKSNDVLSGLFKSKSFQTNYLILVNKSDSALTGTTVSLKGNFTATLKVYPRMGELQNGIKTTAVSSSYNAGITTFQTGAMKPGEALMFEF